MFGTLVISLPSPHTGGDVVVKHCGKKLEFKTSMVTQGHSIIMWYSDVTHEVLPVTSGYRWVLTYKLALDQLSEIASARPSASLALSPQVDTMRQVLSGWMKNN